MLYSKKSPYARKLLPAHRVLYGCTCFDCHDGRRPAEGGGNSVSGIVKDKSGNPIIGVAVTIPNTSRGTSTNTDGRYTIKASGKE